MKKLILISAVFCFLFSCEKTSEKIYTPGRYTLTQINDWTKINFKTDYTIQVPDGFEGIGMIGFEGNTFSKHSADNKINLDYAYCDGLSCSDFGETLTSPVPDRVQILIYPNSSITTKKITYFIQNSDTVGLFYYSNLDNAMGRLFWKDNNTFRAALNVNFSLTEIATVDKIIGTIKGK